MIELIRILEADRDDLRPVVQRYWLGLMPHAPVVQNLERGEAEFLSRFRVDDPDSPLWWAVVDKTRIGFAKVDLGRDGDGRWANIRDFFIEPEWRRQGHGTAFVQALVAWLRDEGVGQIDLSVRQDNPNALAFWQSLGFNLALYHLRQYL